MTFKRKTKNGGLKAKNFDKNRTRNQWRARGGGPGPPLGPPGIFSVRKFLTAFSVKQNYTLSVSNSKFWKRQCGRFDRDQTDENN